MKSYNVSEARENLAAILKQVEEAGERVMLTRHGKPIASIQPIESEIPPPGFGLKEGWTVTMSDDFNDLPEGFEDYV